MKSPPKELRIPTLVSGGLITNYYCTSACRHCLYGCSPRWEKKYIKKSSATRMLQIIARMGCRSVHIGGGEPFLNPDGLEDTLAAASETGISIDYVETNSSWYQDHPKGISLLKRLRRAGLHTLLVSMSPFHNEHIPFYKVKGVLAACRDSGIAVFPWIDDFFPEIDSFDERTPHPLSEYIAAFGSDYLDRIPSRYWIHFGGRALNTFSSSLPGYASEEICSLNGDGCSELNDTRHFHVDLFGNYIPGLCSGLAIQAEHLPGPLLQDEYPILSLLYSEGIRGLYSMARQRFNFTSDDSYISKCYLCLDIRRHMVIGCGVESLELLPVEFYNHV